MITFTMTVIDMPALVFGDADFSDDGGLDSSAVEKDISQPFITDELMDDER